MHYWVLFEASNEYFLIYRMNFSGIIKWSLLTCTCVNYRMNIAWIVSLMEERIKCVSRRIYRILLLTTVQYIECIEQTLIWLLEFYCQYVEIIMTNAYTRHRILTHFSNHTCQFQAILFIFDNTTSYGNCWQYRPPFTPREQYKKRHDSSLYKSSGILVLM